MTQHTLEPLPSVLAFRAEERDAVLRYGESLAREQAAHKAVQVWRDLYSRCRVLMVPMHPYDGERLHDALKQAERDAITAHQDASNALRATPSPLTLDRIAASREVGP